jgi:succinoglycan biosynthesis transport protein ExoP
MTITLRAPPKPAIVPHRRTTGNGSELQVQNHHHLYAPATTLPLGALVHDGMAEEVLAPHVDSVVVHLHPPYDARIAHLLTPDSPQKESFRLLWHRLVASSAPRVIVVTSASQNEGKTTCALSMAAVIGENRSQRVLLLEANPHGPTLGPLLGIGDPRCIVEQIAAGAERRRYWVTYDVPQLGIHVAPAAKNPGHRRFDESSLRGALASLRRAYDYIVIDTPPALKRADVNVVAGVADAVILSARRKHSRLSSIKKTIAQLEPARVAGLALFDVPMKETG